MGHDGDVAALRARLESLDRERAAVAEALRAAETAADPSDRQSALSRAEKVRVFRSLFRGRDDVFPLRWENRSGRSGYSPACRNEWVGGVCEKPRVRCGDCANQAFIAVSDAVVIAHLEGRCVAGVYPLLADNTCWFCAIDLDGTAWREDVAAVRDAAATLGVPLAIERSRSGDGAHAWTFDAAPVAAATARAVASLVLTDATARRPAIGLTSYDRLFPSQDVLPVGGFGNLIALPLQHAARRHGNSVFLDGHLDPAADQWALLSRIERLDPAIAEAIVTAAARRRGGVSVPARTTRRMPAPRRGAHAPASCR